MHKPQEATTQQDHRHAMQSDKQLLGLLLQSSGRIELRLERLEEMVRRTARADRERDTDTMATLDEVIAKVTEAKTVSESTNIAVREVIRLLKESAADPAKLDEAVALLEAMRADDAAMLTDNTPAP